MGRRNKQLEGQREKREQRMVAAFSAHRVTPVQTPHTIISELYAFWSHQALRDPSTWSIPKTRDVDRLRLSAAKHLLAKYPVPSHLEACWLRTDRDKEKDKKVRLWYVCAASGGSLYKQYTRDYLSRKETHMFLFPPVLMEFNQAIWYAVARTYTDNHGSALRVSKSKLARTDRVTPFWRDVARFFATNTVSLNEIDDLYDYLNHRVVENAQFNLKGRTVESLKSGMLQWHHDLNRIKRLGGGSWSGLDAPEYRYVEGKDQNEIVWEINQIKESKKLGEEGNAMRHCVFSYKSQCMAGRSSIWSMTKSKWGVVDRVLTIEVSNLSRRLVQVRGFANRLATASEANHLHRWALEANLDYY